jgi:hypothetical protein
MHHPCGAVKSLGQAQRPSAQASTAGAPAFREKHRHSHNHLFLVAGLMKMNNTDGGNHAKIALK